MRKTIYICDTCGIEETDGEMTYWNIGYMNKDWCPECYRRRENFIYSKFVGSKVTKFIEDGKGLLTGICLMNDKGDFLDIDLEVLEMKVLSKKKIDRELKKCLV